MCEQACSQQIYEEHQMDNWYHFSSQTSKPRSIGQPNISTHLTCMWKSNQLEIIDISSIIRIFTSHSLFHRADRILSLSLGNVFL